MKIKGAFGVSAFFELMTVPHRRPRIQSNMLFTTDPKVR